MFGLQACAAATAIRPIAPTGLHAVKVSTIAISLAWDDMSNKTGYLDFNYYEILRNQINTVPIVIATTTLPSYIDRSVIAQTTYYYMLQAVDRPPDSLVSSTGTVVAVCAMLPQVIIPFNPAIPKMPSGVRLNMTNTSRTITWSPVVLDVNSTPCVNLEGYKVYCSGNEVEGWTQVATVATNQALTWTDMTPLETTLYYKVRAFTTSNVESSDSMLVDTSFNVLAVADDKSAIISMPYSVNSILYKGQQYANDININVATKNEMPAPGAICVYDITAQDSQTNQTLNTFHFPLSQAKMIYFFNSSNNSETPRAINHTAGLNINNISYFWYNGVEWIKMSSAQEGSTITSYTARLGQYMIKQSITAPNFALTKVYPQIFTPNGDHRNDHVEFQFENPQGANLSGKVFDLHGAMVGELKNGMNANSLMWDGTTLSGKIAAPGAYIYQIEVTGSESKIINGVVVLAK
jgi:gliding motility-associated-like protein